MNLLKYLKLLKMKSEGKLRGYKSVKATCSFSFFFLLNEVDRLTWQRTQRGGYVDQLRNRNFLSSLQRC